MRKLSMVVSIILSVFVLSVLFEEAWAATRDTRALRTKDFDGDETFTTLTNISGTGGGTAAISSGQFSTPSTGSGSGVLIIEYSAVGDAHGGSSIRIGCFIDDTTPCAGDTSATAGSVPGWLVALKVPAATGGSDNCNDGDGGAADCHDNGIHYTWCANVTSGVPHKVTIRLAGSEVFVEAQTLVVDFVSSPTCKNLDTLIVGPEQQ